MRHEARHSTAQQLAAIPATTLEEWSESERIHIKDAESADAFHRDATVKIGGRQFPFWEILEYGVTMARDYIYRVEPVGGALHIVTDDLNVADEHLARMEPQRREESFALRRLLPLSPVERLASITLAEFAQGSLRVDFPALVREYLSDVDPAADAIAAYYGWKGGTE